MTFNLIKVRVIHPIQGIYVSCCKTSLHWAGKLRNERKHACTDFLAKRRTIISATTIRNLRQPADFLQDLNRG